MGDSISSIILRIVELKMVLKHVKWLSPKIYI
jgi:hypothetical protein